MHRLSLFFDASDGLLFRRVECHVAEQRVALHLRDLAAIRRLLAIEGQRLAQLGKLILVVVILAFTMTVVAGNHDCRRLGVERGIPVRGLVQLIDGVMLAVCPPSDRCFVAVAAPYRIALARWGSANCLVHVAEVDDLIALRLTRHKKFSRLPSIEAHASNISLVSLGPPPCLVDVAVVRAYRADFYPFVDPG